MKSQHISPLASNPIGDNQGGGASVTGTGTLGQAREKVAQTARDAAAKIKSTAGETAARAKEEAGRLGRDKKEQAASRVGGYSSALHESAKSFEEQDPNIAWFTHQAADRLQGVADYMRNRDFAGLRVDAENVARRHPAVFFGGMFVAGLVLGNILKASQRSSVEIVDEGGYGGGTSDWPGSPGRDGTSDADSANPTTEGNFPGSTAAGM